jgi:DUF1680 family protein
VLRGHRLAEDLTGQVAVQRGPVVYCLESHDLWGAERLEQAAVRRGAIFEPVETSIGGERVIALETDLAVLPGGDADALYSDLGDAPVGTARARLIPYFAWGNRGASEMSVWLPLVW